MVVASCHKCSKHFPCVFTQIFRGEFDYGILKDGESYAHSHPSGTIVETTGNSQPGTATFGGSTTTYAYRQAPSPFDIGQAQKRTNYVFGMAGGKVYIINDQGVQAVLPKENFVNFKK